MDKYFSVIFIDRTYRFPEGLNTYIGLLRFFIRMQDELCACLDSTAKTDEIIKIKADNVMPEIKKSIGKVNAILCENGIDNKSVEEYIEDSCGFKYYTSACETVNKIMTASDEEDNIEGFAVLPTPVFKTAGASNAYDYGCFKNIHDRKSIQSQDGTITETIKNFKKSACDSLTLFVYEVMDMFMMDIINAGKFNESVLQHADFSSSQSALMQLKTSSDKLAVLDRAFRLCPYNDCIYEEALKRNLLDVRTYKTANYFCPDIKIAQQIFDMCSINDLTKKYKNESVRITPFIPILASQLKLSEKATFRFMFKSAYKSFLKTFEELEAIVSYPRVKMKDFVKHNISDDHKELYTLSSDEIELTIETYVKKRIDKDNYTYLKSIGFKFENHPDDIPVERYYAEQILRSVMSYILECKSSSRKLEEIKSEYDSSLNTRNNNILLLELQLSDTPMFALAKKKELRERLAAAKDEAEEFKSSSPYNKEKENFELDYI